MAHTYIYKLDICRSNSAVNIQRPGECQQYKKVFILFELAEIEKTFSTSMIHISITSVCTPFDRFNSVALLHPG